MRAGGRGEGVEAAAAVGFACTRALMQATAPVANPDPDPNPTTLTLYDPLTLTLALTLTYDVC